MKCCLADAACFLFALAGANCALVILKYAKIPVGLYQMLRQIFALVSGISASLVPKKKQ
jgi:hypothetical protein